MRRAKPRTLNAELLQCLRIDCERWYRRKDFREFLNHRTQFHAKENPAEAFWGLATWHRPGDKPGDMSDVFITYDHGESGDSYAMPNDIYEEICRLAEKHGMEYGVVWITNC